MKKIVRFYATTVAYCLVLIFTSQVLAQERDAGQAVVPRGWEDKDSIRFGVYDLYSTTYNTGNPPTSMPQANALADSLQATFEESYGTIPYTFPYFGKRKGYMAYADTLRSWKPDFSMLAYLIKQRIYYPLPHRLRFKLDSGYYWRYIDTTRYSWYENRYDANDISPYAQIDTCSTVVAEDLITKRFTGSLDTVKYGNHGRVILGYQDNRLADQLLRTQEFDYFPRGAHHIPKRFSVRLEFNVDPSGMITSNSLGVPSDDLPLLRVQVAFKPAGQHVMPFVPFKTLANPTDSGWFIIADQIVTHNTYKDLDTLWRAEDTLESGLQARNWKFKQLNIPLVNMPVSMSNLIDTTFKSKETYGWGSVRADRIPGFLHPDILVGADTNLDTKDLNLLEIRILSTYRAKVRIRALCYQDTLCDRFFLRKKFGGAVHSCNADGSIGGWDDSVSTYTDEWATVLDTLVPREFIVNDHPKIFSALSASICGYLDYMLQKRNIHLHLREQENLPKTDLSAHFRRERMSHDGQPPSLFENQHSFFHSAWYRRGGDYSFMGSYPRDVFPHDYIVNGWPVDSSFSWPSVKDTMYGLVIGRLQDTGDVLKAYKRYTDIYGGLNVQSEAFRVSGRFGLHHPKGKQHAIELSPQGWGEWKHYDGATFHPHYNMRPTTPEETQVQLYVGLANGATVFNNCQTFDAVSGNQQTNGAPGCFGVAKDADNVNTAHFDYTAGYNIGHRFSRWQDWDTTDPQRNEMDRTLDPFYLGYSNTYRSWKRTLQRINQIYDTNGYNRSFPFKRLKWVDAYSANRALPSDSDAVNRATWSSAFLKCVGTSPVKRWTRTTTNGFKVYIDSTSSGNPIFDDSTRTYVEVGLFEDSTNAENGYAAMIVNTRLWPSLRDAEDSIYYNEGLATIDRSRSTHGDIDTRKVWFKIDTTILSMPLHHKSAYYVVRDVWHQDTTYLVHVDSMFGIYMKPGEARLLHIKKGIAIDVATDGRTEQGNFGYNNGRRVAEILGGTQSVVTYVRDGRLYVSYPGKGTRFEGYNQRSAGENITTGFEICLDSTGTCSHPSITAGMNDQSVGIVYHTTESGGRIKVAYQHVAPYSTWFFSMFTDKLFDETDVEITPVITPYAEMSDSLTSTSFDDSTWWVAVPYKKRPGNNDPSGIAALKVKVSATGASFIIGGALQYFYQDPVGTQAADRSQFPTITSRPLHKKMFPVRLAWQKMNQIYYNRFNETVGAVTASGANEIISDEMSNFCYNFHPSIALSSREFKDPKDLTDSGAFGGQIPMGVGPNMNKKLLDWVVWESRIKNKKWNSNLKTWPVLRQRTQYLDLPSTPGFWSTFGVFQPKFDTNGYHWPNITATSRDDKSNTAFQLKRPFYEYARIGWNDEVDDSLHQEFVHIRPWVSRTNLLENGKFPSMSQATFDVRTYTDSSRVMPSVVFAGLETDADGLSKVRITNGWFPWVGTEIRNKRYFGFRIAIIGTGNCAIVADWDGDIGRPIITPNGGDPKEIDWLTLDPQLGAFPHNWPVTPYLKVEYRSETFTAYSLDSIIVPRQADTIDLAAFRAGFVDSSDYVMSKITLRRAVDSSWVATIDSSFITMGTASYPGNGLDASFAKYRYPGLGLTDSVFIELEVLRGNASSNFTRAVMEYDSPDSITTYAFKRSPRTPQSIKTDNIKLDIRPNPTDYTAIASISVIPGSLVKVELFDIGGKKISTVFDQISETGVENIKLDGTLLPAGSYFVRIQSGNDIVTKRLELIR